MKMSCLLSVWVVGLAVYASAARAEVSPADRALAQSLFEQGRALMDARNYEEGCPKLAESHRIDPGGGTLINLALCYEQAGKLASAWGAFNEAIDVARQDGREDREEFAQEHVAALQPKLSYLTIVAPTRSSELTVSIDGRELNRAAWGTKIPLDPGEHRVTVTSPGKRTWSVLVTIGPEADQQKLEIPVLGNARPDDTSMSTHDPNGDSRLATRKAESSTAGYWVLGAGVLVVGAGSYFGLRAMADWDERNEHCPNGRCDARAVELADDTKRNATIANVSVGLGLVGVGVGTYLILAAPAEESGTTVVVQPAVGSSGGGVGLGGVW